MARSNAKEQRGLKFVVPKRDIVLSRLAAVASRLRRSDRLIVRLAAEDTKLTPSQYVARLRKTRAELIKQAESLNGEYLEERAATAKFTAPAISRKSHGDRDRHGAEFEDFEPRLLSLLAGALVQAQQVGGGACEEQEGFLLPWYTRVAEVSPSSINHGSTTSMLLDESQLDQYGIMFARAVLVDDAAWYRDDNPDIFVTGYELGWRWDPAPCNMWVMYRVFANQQGNFVNAADEVGGCGTAAVVFHSDAAGQFPDQMSLAGSTQLLATYSTQSFVSDPVEFAACFPIDQGQVAKVVMGHLIKLAAQDGMVSMTAGFRAGTGSASWGPPRLWYRLVPR